MPRDDPRNLQWVDLTDFRPGIFNRSQRVLGSAAVPAPLGAAQEANTYRCCALASGGLAPLPKQSQTYAGPALDTPANITDGPHVVGFLANGQITGTASNRSDELHFGVEYLYNNAGTSERRFKWVHLADLGNTNTTFAVVQITSTQPNPGSAFWGMTFATSRMLPAGSPDFTQPGFPVVVGAWSVVGGAYDKFVRVFPDPGTPGAEGTLALYSHLGANAFPGVKAHTHQGRVVVLEDIFYAHGAVGATPLFQEVDEQIVFTDPPNSPTLGTQNQVFAQEYATGYCAVGSISAGELFLIKRRGGGVIISGDIANPSVTRLPGVVSGGSIQSKAASTVNGLFYATGDMGAYSWRGGDSSTKISPQLEDNFYIHPSTTNYLGQEVFFEEWGDWVVCSNNWLYDTQTNGWWRFEDPAVRRYWGVSRSFNSRFMYACVASYVNAGDVWAVDFDRELPALSYSWQSQPIPATVNRLTEVRDLVLVAQGSGTVNVTLTAFDGSTQVENFTVTNSSQPQRLRPAQGGTFIKGYNVVVRIQATGADKAPIVHSLHLGTVPAQPAVAT